MENTTFPSTLFDVISDVEGSAAPLEEVIATLVLFEELLHNAVEWLNPLQPYTVDLFTRRYKLLAAMLSMTMRELEQHEKEIHASIKKAYLLNTEINNNGSA